MLIDRGVQRVGHIRINQRRVKHDGEEIIAHVVGFDAAIFFRRVLFDDTLPGLLLGDNLAQVAEELGGEFRILPLQNHQHRRFLLVLNLQRQHDPAAGHGVDQFGPRMTQFVLEMGDKLAEQLIVGRGEVVAIAAKAVQFRPPGQLDEQVGNRARLLDLHNDVGHGRHEPERIGWLRRLRGVRKENRRTKEGQDDRSDQKSGARHRQTPRSDLENSESQTALWVYRVNQPNCKLLPRQRPECFKRRPAANRFARRRLRYNEGMIFQILQIALAFAVAIFFIGAPLWPTLMRWRR